MTSIIELVRAISEEYKTLRPWMVEEQGNDPPQDLFESIRYSMRTYPSISRNAGNVLHHMYFVIGNGYEWKKGKLLYYDQHSVSFSLKLAEDARSLYNQLPTEVFDENYRKKELERATDEALWLEIRNEIREVQYKSKALKHHIDVLDEMEERIADPSFERGERPEEGINFRPYPPSRKYSAFFNVPENVTEDYLLGAVVSGQQFLRFKERTKPEHHQMVEDHLATLIQHYKDKYGKKPIWRTNFKPTTKG